MLKGKVQEGQTLTSQDKPSYTCNTGKSYLLFEIQFKAKHKLKNIFSNNFVKSECKYREIQVLSDGVPFIPKNGESE